jgi:hypothetical protein
VSTRYVLEIVEGPGTGKQIPVDGSLEIGRDDSVGLVLGEDELVSRRHALVTSAADGIFVEDLGSTNGTFVDNDQVHGRAHLRPGQELLVGVTVLELRTRAGATIVRPVPSGSWDPPPVLARPEREPDYVSPARAPDAGGEAELFPLLDIHTKSKARAAPLAIFVLVTIVVIIFLALR